MMSKYSEILLPTTCRLACIIFLTASLSQAATTHPFKGFDQRSFAQSLYSFINSADQGFATLKGSKMQNLGDKWEADPSLPGAYFCDVDWNQRSNSPDSKAELICVYGEGLTRQDALNGLTALDNAVRIATQNAGWRPIIKEGKDSMVLFKPPAGLACGWMSVWFMTGQDNQFRLFFSIDATKTPSQLMAQGTSTSSQDFEMQEWVREDIQEYIAASKSNFEGYKSGSPPVVKGNRAWISNAKPLLADWCKVIELDTSRNVFACQLSHYSTRNEAQKAYADLIVDVGRSLSNWTWSSKPFATEVDSSAVMSSSLGLEGEIWVHNDPGSSEWSVRYQLVRR